MARSLLFAGREKAAEIGSLEHPKPNFKLYESRNLRSVGVCSRLMNKSFPMFLPRPFEINSVQAHAVRLALIQFYRSNGWEEAMSEEQLVRVDMVQGLNTRKPPLGGFVIGDGTGVGKTREIAAFLLSTVILKRALQDSQAVHGPEVMRCGDPAVLRAVESGRWKRAPFFIWLTRSEPLFLSCQEGLREVVTRSTRGGGGGAWGAAYRDTPRDFKGGGKTGYLSLSNPSAATGDEDSLLLRFFLLRDIKKIMERNGTAAAADTVTAAPSVLFMTYATLQKNLEFLLEFLTGCSSVGTNMAIPMDNFVTAVLCDEFHQTKNISDAFRDELERAWAEEDRVVMGGGPRPVNPPLGKILERFRAALVDGVHPQGRRVRIGGYGRSGADPEFLDRAQAACPGTGLFLKRLSLADSFRLLMEVLKYDSFFLMASATPFQSRADLHMIDHIIRRSLPAYTSMAAFKSGAGHSATPDAIADNREYMTVSLEGMVRLLYNRGYLVSRSISIEGVECSVVNCNMTPLQRFALDELSSYFIECRRMLFKCKEAGMAVMEALGAALSGRGRAGVSALCMRELAEFINAAALASAVGLPFPTARGAKRKRGAGGDGEEGDELASLSPTLRSALVGAARKIGREFSVVVVEEGDLSEDGHTSMQGILREALVSKGPKNKCRAEGAESAHNAEDDADEVAQELLRVVRAEGSGPGGGVTNPARRPASEMVFGDEVFQKLARQYLVNNASTTVSVCKSALLCVKAQSVPEAVARLRLAPTPQKTVMSLEQTGDSFLTNLAERVLRAKAGRRGGRTRAGHLFGLVPLGAFDSSPLGNTALSGYRLLCRAVAIVSAARFVMEGGAAVYACLVPRLPPEEPLLALAGNPLDGIAQAVGETKHSEITNRKICSRITGAGLLLLRPNNKTIDTNRCIATFNDTAEVDVMLLGPKGSTGLSLHDSAANGVSAKRIHCLLDVPYNAVDFLQTIGRTNRNGQASKPHFLIFSSDSPAERRFFESLESRVRDSKAGTFADRYSDNSVNVAGGTRREEFLDKGLVLRTLGRVVRIITSDISRVELMGAFAKMTMVSRDSGLLTFVEGIDAENRVFLSTALLAAEITEAAAGGPYHRDPEQQSSEARIHLLVLGDSEICSVAAAAAKFAYSNFGLQLVHRPVVANDPLLSLLRDALKRLHALVDERVPRGGHSGGAPSPGCAPHTTSLPSRPRNSQLDLYSDLTAWSEWQADAWEGEGDLDVGSELGGLDDDEVMGAIEMPIDETVLQILAEARPPDKSASAAAAAVHTPLTVRILGAGVRKGVVSASRFQEAPSTDMLALLPTITACNVIGTLCRENGDLVLDTYLAALPHSCGSPHQRGTSMLLDLARRLCRGTMNYRQFQNNYFSPVNESQLIGRLFVHVQSIMARDNRLDGLCENRMNSVIGASYMAVRKKPRCVLVGDLLDRVRMRHVAAGELPKGESGRTWAVAIAETGVGDGLDHDLDVVLSNGARLTLNRGNSVFVEDHIVSFLAGNLIGTDGSVIQICFDNCEGGPFDGMPRFCIFERRSVETEAVDGPM
uniref:Wsv026-like protein n=1 Tax=Sicyonia whispovirus TaxID=2984283 RepID=A0A9C7BNS5_9VIRU|nr:MAG: wsv026-like protein [Sicyonia whispovirus]